MNDSGAGLREVYDAIAECWCSPQDVDVQAAARRAEAAIGRLNGTSGPSRQELAGFLACPVSEEAYVRLFELDPLCPLYVGSHVFDEPKTCAQAGMSDRNGYMIELLGIYRHFGLAPDPTELPDYLPLMLEFLSLTAGSEDPPRRKLIAEYLVPHLPALRARLEELKTPYLNLLAVLEQVLAIDLEEPLHTGE